MMVDRNQAILDAAQRYVDKEGRTAGQWRGTVEQAIADMIGASQYLKLRLGDDTARLAVARLHDAMIG